MKYFLLLIVSMLSIDLLYGQDLNFGSEYNKITWPVSLGVGGGIVGDDGQYKRVAIYHGNSISLQVGSNVPGLGNSKLFVGGAAVGIKTVAPVSDLQILDGPVKIAIGAVPSSASSALGWAYNYIGFNVVRNNLGWIASSDGTNSGGSMLLNDIFGNFRIVNAPSAGNNNQTLTEAQINQLTRFKITSSGDVGIGTPSPDAKLAVNGTIHSKEVKVDLNISGPDYVFEKDYALPSLESVKTYIDQNKHLPEVPSAKEMEANGINLSEMNMLLLKKVEELTLYQIQYAERIQKLEKEIDRLKK